MAQGDFSKSRVASFMATKREGMLVGRVDPDGLETLISTIKEAKKVGQSIVFFLWSNRPGSRFVAALTAAVDRPREQANPVSRKPIRGTSQEKADPLATLFGGGAPAKAEPAAPAEDDW